MAVCVPDVGVTFVEAVDREWGPNGHDGESTQYQLQMASFVDSPHELMKATSPMGQSG